MLRFYSDHKTQITFIIYICIATVVLYTLVYNHVRFISTSYVSCANVGSNIHDVPQAYS